VPCSPPFRSRCRAMAADADGAPDVVCSNIPVPVAPVQTGGGSRCGTSASVEIRMNSQSPPHDDRERDDGYDARPLPIVSRCIRRLDLALTFFCAAQGTSFESLFRRAVEICEPMATDWCEAGKLVREVGGRTPASGREEIVDGSTAALSGTCSQPDADWASRGSARRFSSTRSPSSLRRRTARRSFSRPRRAIVGRMRVPPLRPQLFKLSRAERRRMWPGVVSQFSALPQASSR
jgi:hypothetical protein